MGWGLNNKKVKSAARLLPVLGVIERSMAQLQRFLPNNKKAIIALFIRDYG
jgi:hypothetical protein